MTESQFSLLKQIVEQNQSFIQELREELREMSRTGRENDLCVVRIEARLKSLEGWQQTLMRHFERTRDENSTWVRDVSIALLGGVIAFLATKYGG